MLPEIDYYGVVIQQEITMNHLDYPTDPADLEDELRERSENIIDARDNAYERGYEMATGPGDEIDRDQYAEALFDHPRLQTDFRDGWDTAVQHGRETRPGCIDCET